MAYNTSLSLRRTYLTQYAILSIGMMLFVILLSSCTDKHTYPAATIHEFRASCVSSNVTKHMCACLLDKIQETYTYAEFTKIENAIKTGEDTTEFMTFIKNTKASCAKVQTSSD